MEPIEVTSTLSPKETIVNILGRLFNNGHISSEELMMMQTELITHPKEESPALDMDLIMRLLRTMNQKTMTHSPFTEPVKHNPYQGGSLFEHSKIGDYGLTSPADTLAGSIGLPADTSLLSGVPGGSTTYIDANSLLKKF